MADRQPRAPEAGATPRDLTGVPGLDEILGGGLPRGSLVIVTGSPGSGKTILASQLAFASAQVGRRALITTTLSEPPGKVVEHLGGFDFYDSVLVGSGVQFLSLQRALDETLDGIVDELIAVARQGDAKLVVVDGFSGIRGVISEPQEARQFLYRLAGTLGTLGMTVVITNEANPRDPATFPEATTADIIIGLSYSVVAGRHRRGIEVIKVRGAAQLPGVHGLTLSSSGVLIYPRLESRVTAGLERSTVSPRHILPGLEDPLEDFPSFIPTGVPVDRATFGLQELDALLDGGLTRGTSTVLAGSLGTGKTLLALHFALASVRSGEPAVFVGFRETARQLAQKADVFALGTELRAALAPKGGLALLRWDPVDLQPDIVADRLLRELDTTGAQRLVVDSIIELERAVIETSDLGRVDGFMAALVKAMRLRGVSALYVRETRRAVTQGQDFTADELSVLAENVLLQQQVSYRGQLHRVLSVLKMRFSAHDRALREFTIAPPAGIRVLTPFESGVDVLAGIVRQQEGALSGMLHAAESRDPAVEDES